MFITIFSFDWYTGFAYNELGILIYLLFKKEASTDGESVLAERYYDSYIV